MQTREIKERQKEHDRPEISKTIQGILGHVFWTLI